MEAVYTFMSELFDTINKKYSSIKLFNLFKDGPTSKFKQRFLFSNLHGWENEFNFKIVFNFFATSHGKGAVNGIGGTIKCLVWTNVRSTAAAPNDAVAYYETGEKLKSGNNDNIYQLTQRKMCSKASSIG